MPALGSFHRVRPGTTGPKLNLPGAAVVVNAASFEEGISPGSIATIFGPGIAPVRGVVQADRVPLPTSLAGVSVLVDGFPAPIFIVANVDGQEQVNFQVPFEVEPGPGAEIEVITRGQTAALITTDVFTEDPALFTLDGYYAVAIRAGSYTSITRDAPISPGEYVILYATGLGEVDNDPGTGYPGPGDRLAYTIYRPDVLVDGRSAQIDFSGLAPGFVGVYQLNVRLPNNLPRGDVDLQISIRGSDSKRVTLPVR